jgi:hypothetical protein
MNTFYQMWGVTTPEAAQSKIDEQKAEAVAVLNGREPQNLEEQALTLVGKDIFEKLIKEYTEKQWGRKCTELPALFLIFFLYLSKLEFPSWNKYPERKKKVGTAIVANLPPPFINAFKKGCSVFNVQ